MEIQIQNRRVHYREEGTGDVVVLLHGWGSNITLFDGLFKVLSGTHRVIAPDMPGFGRTPEPEEPWSVDDYVDFCLAFFEALHLEKFALVGHSFGGRVIIKLFARENLPYTIPKVVLMDSAGILPQKTRRQKMGNAWYHAARRILGCKPVSFLYPDALEALRKKRGSADYNNATPTMRATLVKVVNEDLEPYLTNMTCPVLLIWGDRDTATPLSDAKKMEEILPDAGLVICEGAGHYAFLEQPGVVHGALVSFLS